MAAANKAAMEFESRYCPKIDQRNVWKSAPLGRTIYEPDATPGLMSSRSALRCEPPNQALTHTHTLTGVHQCQPIIF